MSGIAYGKLVLMSTNLFDITPILEQPNKVLQLHLFGLLLETCVGREHSW